MVVHLGGTKEIFSDFIEIVESDSLGEKAGSCDIQVKMALGDKLDYSKHIGTHCVQVLHGHSSSGHDIISRLLEDVLFDQA